MKIVFISFLSVALIRGCNDKKTTPEATAPLMTEVVPVDTASVLSFENDIMPIFKGKCSPCHFPGGKMYERMPFDKSQTLKTHSEGILRRMKANPDIDKIKKFIESIP